MKVNDFLCNYHVDWLNDGTLDKDIALATRIRLARNFKDLAFPNRADLKQLAEAQGRAVSLQEELGAAIGQKMNCLSLKDLGEVQKHVLVEKYLVTKKFLAQPQNRSVLVSDNGSTSIMVNEEDHLRIQCMAGGLNLEEPLQRAMKLDDAFEQEFDVAFDEKMGYLTSCPTNLGTGLRATVFLHLPGLVYTQQISEIVNISPQLGLAVRALYGAGYDAVGNIFQISNQLTLGFTEQELAENMLGAVKEIIEHEIRARKALNLYSKERMEDNIWRAYGTLRYARYLGDAEALELISKVRMGQDMGILTDVSRARLSDLLVASRTHFLQNICGNENMSKTEIDRKRAAMVRSILTGSHDWGEEE